MRIFTIIGNFLSFGVTFSEDLTKSTERTSKTFFRALNTGLDHADKALLESAVDSVDSEIVANALLLLDANRAS